MKKLTKKLEKYWDMRIGDTIAGLMVTNYSKDEIVKKIEHIFRKRLGANEQEAREETAKAYAVVEFYMLPENCLVEKEEARPDFRGVDLRFKNLEEEDFWKADLRGADLRGIEAEKVRFTFADLRGANLQGANFRGADLAHADLREADLRFADLRGADLWKAKITETQKETLLQSLGLANTDSYVGL